MGLSRKVPAGTHRHGIDVEATTSFRPGPRASLSAKWRVRLPSPAPISSTRFPTAWEKRSTSHRLYGSSLASRVSVTWPTLPFSSDSRKRCFTIVQSAETASFQPIFLPSS
jgi:hypothetical protein